MIDPMINVLSVLVEFGFKLGLAIVAVAIISIVPRFILFRHDKYLKLESFKDWFNNHATSDEKCFYYAARIAAVYIASAIAVGFALS